MIGREKPRAPGNNPVPVVIGVAGEGEVKAVLHPYQSLHRIGRGRVHADLAIPIDRHETERRIDGLVDDREVQPVALGNRPPVVDAGATERIDPQADLCAANDLHVDYIAKVARVGVEVVVPMGCGRPKRLLERNSVNAPQATFEKLVRLHLDPVSDDWTRRPADWGIVLEAAVMGRIMRRRDHDAIGKTCFPPTVVRQNRVGNGRGRGIFIPGRDHDFHPVCRQHLKRAGKSWHGEGMRVHAEEQWAVDLLLRPVQANGLTYGQDMPLVESLFECGTTVPGGAEGNSLFRH